MEQAHPHLRGLEQAALIQFFLQLLLPEAVVVVGLLVAALLLQAVVQVAALDMEVIRAVVEILHL